jgi:hypothetical protein
MQSVCAIECPSQHPYHKHSCFICANTKANCHQLPLLLATSNMHAAPHTCMVLRLHKHWSKLQPRRCCCCCQEVAHAAPGSCTGIVYLFAPTVQDALLSSSVLLASTAHSRCHRDKPYQYPTTTSGYCDKPSTARRHSCQCRGTPPTLLNNTATYAEKGWAGCCSHWSSKHHSSQLPFDPAHHTTTFNSADKTTQAFQPQHQDQHLISLSPVGCIELETLGTLPESSKPEPHRSSFLLLPVSQRRHCSTSHLHNTFLLTGLHCTLHPC